MFICTSWKFSFSVADSSPLTLLSFWGGRFRHHRRFLPRQLYPPHSHDDRSLTPMCEAYSRRGVVILTQRHSKCSQLVHASLLYNHVQRFRGNSLFWPLRALRTKWGYCSSATTSIQSIYAISSTCILCLKW